MTRAEQRIADLEDRVADLAAEVENLRAEAFVLRTLEEMMVRDFTGGRVAATSVRRPRHLRLVGGVS